MWKIGGILIIVRNSNSVTCYSFKFYKIVRIKDSDYFNLNFKRKTKKELNILLKSNGLEFQYIKKN